MRRLRHRTEHPPGADAETTAVSRLHGAEQPRRGRRAVEHTYVELEQPGASVMIPRVLQVCGDRVDLRHACEEVGVHRLGIGKVAECRYGFIDSI